MNAIIVAGPLKVERSGKFAKFMRHVRDVADEATLNIEIASWNVRRAMSEGASAVAALARFVYHLLVYAAEWIWYGITWPVRYVIATLFTLLAMRLMEAALGDLQCYTA